MATKESLENKAEDKFELYGYIPVGGEIGTDLWGERMIIPFLRERGIPYELRNTSSSLLHSLYIPKNHHEMVRKEYEKIRPPYPWLG